MIQYEKVLKRSNIWVTKGKNIAKNAKNWPKYGYKITMDTTIGDGIAELAIIYCVPLNTGARV